MGIHNIHFSLFVCSAEQCLPPTSRQKRLHQHRHINLESTVCKERVGISDPDSGKLPVRLRSGKGEKYRNDDGAVSSGGSHVLVDIDVDGNTERGCLSQIRQGVTWNWRTP